MKSVLKALFVVLPLVLMIYIVGHWAGWKKLVPLTLLTAWFVIMMVLWWQMRGKTHI